GLVLDRRRELVALALGPIDVALAKASRRRKDRRARRAELVRYGVEQLRLEIVRPAEDLGLRRLLAKSRALDRQAQLRRCDREHAFLGRSKLWRSSLRQHGEATHAHACRDDGHEASSAAGAGRRGSNEADGARGTGRVHEPQLATRRSKV